MPMNSPTWWPGHGRRRDDGKAPQTRGPSRGRERRQGHSATGHTQWPHYELVRAAGAEPGRSRGPHCSARPGTAPRGLQEPTPAPCLPQGVSASHMGARFRSPRKERGLGTAASPGALRARGPALPGRGQPPRHSSPVQSLLQRPRGLLLGALWPVHWSRCSLLALI